MGRRFGNILETVGNTPVVKINRLAPPGSNLFVKFEAFNPLGSVKDRLALGVIEAAEQSGQLKPGQICHRRPPSAAIPVSASPWCAPRKAMHPLVVTMAETFSVERRKLMRFLGAKASADPGGGRQAGLAW